MDTHHITRSSHFKIRLLGNFAILRRVVGAFEVFDGWGKDNRSFRDSVMAIREQMDFCYGPAHFDRLSLPHEFGRKVHRSDQEQKGSLWVYCGDNAIRKDLFPICKHYA